jgi:hypothetical protein
MGHRRKPNGKTTGGQSVNNRAKNRKEGWTRENSASGRRLERRTKADECRSGAGNAAEIVVFSSEHLNRQIVANSL